MGDMAFFLQNNLCVAGDTARQHIVGVAGGRTGRDGIHGATFSSVELSSESESQSGGSVQIGHAIHEKMVTDFVLAASEEHLFHAITDCGAGGLSSAIGEMGAELGAEVDLEKVPLKYDGLSATEVWISEAQERMVLAVSPSEWPRLAEVARLEGVEATPIGTFTGNGQLALRWNGERVGDLNCHFLHEGRPRERLQSIFTPPQHLPVCWSLKDENFETVLLELLRSEDVASKEWIIRQYDHEDQGKSVLKPLLGPMGGPADATVIRGVLGRPRGILIGVGIQHHLGTIDPFEMAVGGIVEAISNCIASGADPERIALLDNFCWGDCRRPDSLGTLVEACRGCYEAAVTLQAPFVSGKDSLNSLSGGHQAFFVLIGQQSIAGVKQPGFKFLYLFINELYLLLGQALAHFVHVAFTLFQQGLYNTLGHFG